MSIVPDVASCSVPTESSPGASSGSGLPDPPPVGADSLARSSNPRPTVFETCRERPQNRVILMTRIGEPPKPPEPRVILMTRIGPPQPPPVSRVIPFTRVGESRADQRPSPVTAEGDTGE